MSIPIVSLKDPFDVVVDYGEKRLYALVKAGYVFIDFFKLVGAISHPGWSKLRSSLALFKLTRSPYRLVDETIKFKDKVIAWKESPNAEEISVSGLFRSSLSLVNPTWEIVDFSTKAIFHISKDSVWFLKGLNAVALVISNLWTFYDSSVKIASKDEAVASDAKSQQKLIGLARTISFFALGVLATANTFFGCVFAPAYFTILSTVTVILGFAQHYSKAIGTEKTVLEVTND